MLCRNAADISIEAIMEILLTEYNPEAKLYAIRVYVLFIIQYLKDCFEKANERFIKRSEVEVLPILEKII